MEQSTLVSGMRRVTKRDVAFKYGSMDPCMRATGRAIKQTEKVVSSMLMVISTTENGKMTKHTVLAPIITLTVPNTREIGSRTSNTVKVRRNGLMVPAMKAPIQRVRNTAKVNSCGQTSRRMRVISTITTSRAKEFTLGRMAENMLASG